MKLLWAASAAFASTISVPASAAIIEFTGSRSNIDAAGPAAARCGTRTTNNVVNNPPTSTSAGLSNLGAFTPTLSHCIQLPLSNAAPNPFDLGQFTFDFGGGSTLLGTYSGVVNFLSPGTYSVSQTHLVTGGTGFFAGSSGSFTSAGTLSFLTGRPTVSQTFAGSLDVPAAVPEPATWSMLILGFGTIGMALRQRRRAAVGIRMPMRG